MLRATLTPIPFYETYACADKQIVHTDGVRS